MRKQTAANELASLRNLGPKSAAWLNAVGIHTRKDLVRFGPVKAYYRVKQGGFKPSLNLLYALAGAIMDVHWNKLPRDERSRLLIEADALEQAVKAGKEK